MPNGTKGSLDKVLSKLTPRIIAILLTVVVFAFVVVILIAINKGAEINFWGFEISPKGKVDHHSASDVAGGMTAQEFVATLPIDVQGSVEESRKKIATKIGTLEERVEAIENELTETKKQLAQVLEEKTNLQRIIEEKEDRFLNKIIRLEDEITRWEGSINTSVKVDEKQEVFRLVQQLLRRIGYYVGPIDADPIRTREALSKYKQDKGFKDEELLTHVTRQTVIFMVRDYAETLLKESRG